MFEEDKVTKFIKAGLDLHLDYLHRPSQKDLFKFSSSWGIPSAEKHPAEVLAWIRSGI